MPTDDRMPILVLAVLCAAVAGMAVMLKPSLVEPMGVAATVFVATAAVLKL